MRSNSDPLNLKNRHFIIGICTFVSSRRFSSHDVLALVFGVSSPPFWCYWGPLGRPWRHFGSYLGAPNACRSIFETAFQLPRPSGRTSRSSLEPSWRTQWPQEASKLSPETWSDRLTSQIDPQNLKLTTNFRSLFWAAFRFSHIRLQW